MKLSKLALLAVTFNRARFSLALLFLATAFVGATAGAQTFAGRLDDPANAALVASNMGAPSFADEFAIANNVALYDLVVSFGGTVTIQSTGFATGGVDPYFTLFSGAGGSATFLDSNYLQAFSTGGDFSYSATLAAGAYRIALGAFANISFAENSGTGNFEDGFVGLGDPSSLGDGSYRVVATQAVPEPASWALLAIGLAMFSVRILGNRPKLPLDSPVFALQIASNVLSSEMRKAVRRAMTA